MLTRATKIDKSTAQYPSLAGKRVLVTGGASGIGEALVSGFAGQGAHVAFLDMQGEAGEALVRRLSGDGMVAPRFALCDLTDLDSLGQNIARLAAEIGDFDILLNNAANDDRHKIDEVTPAYWDERIAVNLRHLFFAAQAVIPGMRAVGGGSIINFGSISWHLALPELVLYQTAKAAIEGMTRSMARELGPDNIRANTIIPGNVETPRQAKWYTPEGEAEIIAAQCLKKRVQPVDIAAMALFLASDDAHMCTGHNYWVDAGWR